MMDEDGTHDNNKDALFDDDDFIISTDQADINNDNVQSIYDPLQSLNLNSHRTHQRKDKDLEDELFGGDVVDEDALFGIDDDDDGLFGDDDLGPGGEESDLFHTTVLSDSKPEEGIVIATAPKGSSAIRSDPLSAEDHDNYIRNQMNYPTTGAMMMSSAPPPGDSIYIAQASNTTSPTQQNPSPSPKKQIHPSFENATFSHVSVTDPRLVSSAIGGGGFLSSLTGQPNKYWVYTVSATQLSNKTTIQTQRRFRHFDALQDRVREACPGAILPSRPPKHAVLEDNSVNQSPAFAAQRVKELNEYLNALVMHPIAGGSQPLHFFLTFPHSDLGSAWPEVSNSALTRFTAGVSKTANEASAAAAAGLNSLDWAATLNTGLKASPNPTPVNPSEDTNPGMLSLAYSEQHRMDLVSQAIPKIEGWFLLLRDTYQTQGLLAMEWAKLAKDMRLLDRPLSSMADTLSQVQLKSSRKSRKSSTDAIRALHSYLKEPKIVAMERLAFADRSDSLEKMWRLRQKTQSLMHPRSSPLPLSQRAQYEAEHAYAYNNSLLEGAVQRAETIEFVLYNEVNRIRTLRRNEWVTDLATFVAIMKQNQTALKTIWLEVKQQMDDAANV